MLAIASSNNGLVDNTTFEPLKVVLPAHLRVFYAEHGYHPTIATEYRHNSRMRVRSVGQIRFDAPPPGMQLPALPEGAECGTILIKDISKTGIGILYHRQIFPGEAFEVYFLNRVLKAVASRCRREGELCYETGARVLSVRAVEDESNWDATDEA